MLLLDIDHVLLRWTDRETEPYRGFNWRVVNQRYFSSYSPDQLKLIHDEFDKIVWHTTWCRDHTNMANEYFCDVTDFATRKSFPAIVRSEYQGRQASGLPLTVMDHCYWWKLLDLAHWLDLGHRGRFVWADDQLKDAWFDVRYVLDYYDMLDRVYCVAPVDGWSRQSILDASEWLRDDRPSGKVLRIDDGHE